MPAAISEMSQVVLYPGEFAVLPHANLDLRIPKVRDGVVTLSQVHPTHVVAGHFTSAIDVWDGTRKMAQAFRRACPAEEISIRLIHLPPFCRRPSHTPRRVPIFDRAARTLAHDIQEAFRDHGVWSHRIPVDTRIPSNTLDTGYVRDRRANRFSIHYAEQCSDVIVEFRDPSRPETPNPRRTSAIARRVSIRDISWTYGLHEWVPPEA